MLLVLSLCGSASPVEIRQDYDNAYSDDATDYCTGDFACT